MTFVVILRYINCCHQLSGGEIPACKNITKNTYKLNQGFVFVNAAPQNKQHRQPLIQSTSAAVFGRDNISAKSTTVFFYRFWWMHRDHGACLNAASRESTRAKERVRLHLLQTASVHQLTRSRKRLWAEELKWNTKDWRWKKGGEKNRGGTRKVKKLLAINWVEQSDCKCQLQCKNMIEWKEVNNR